MRITWPFFIFIMHLRVFFQSEGFLMLTHKILVSPCFEIVINLANGFIINKRFLYYVLYTRTISVMYCIIIFEPGKNLQEAVSSNKVKVVVKFGGEVDDEGV